MGLTHISARIANPGRPSKTARLKFLVDSGALYSVVPTATLQRLGIRPHTIRTFMLADGTEIKRRVGDALFLIDWRGPLHPAKLGRSRGPYAPLRSLAFDGNRAASPVIFGERGDRVLMGTVSLESLGLLLDPMKRVLRPLPMVLGSVRRG